MPTLAKQSKKLGKAIRKATGIPLPNAMTYAKKLVRNDGYVILNKEFVHSIRVELCGDGCCTEYRNKIIGPKGEYVFT